MLQPRRAAMTGEAASAYDRQPVPILHYTTEHLPPESRYKAWLLRDWPRRTQIYLTEPIEPFNTRWESVQLGQIMFVYTEITGMRWERRAIDIRQSDFDPVVINMMITGLAQGDMDGRAFHEPAGTLHFHDFGRPSLHVSTASTTYSTLVPRPLAQQWFGPLRDLHGLVVPVREAEMLFAHAAQTRRMLHRLDAITAASMGRVFLELAAVALAQVRADTPLQETADSLLLQRAEEMIERRLGEGRITIADLCQSRGGIHSYIAGFRLDRARAALADVDRIEPIGNIAHRFGFSDSPHLSRAFRARFGMTPREYRHLVATNQAEIVPD